MKIFNTLLFFLLFNTFQAQSQSDSQINVRLDGLKSPQVTIGFYLGDGMYLADSVKVDTILGAFNFSTKKLTPGEYFIAIKEGRLFNFMLDKTGQSFQINGSMMRLDSLIAENSPENTAFLQFEGFSKKQDAKIEQANASLEMIRRAAKNDRSILAEFEKNIQNLQREKLDMALKLSKENPDFLWSKVVKTIQVPEVPSNIPLLLENKRVNPAYYSYIQKHYWDNMNFQDSTLLYNQLWINYFENYLGRFTAAHPDSLNANIDLLLQKTPKNGYYYRYLVKFITQKFELTDWPFADKVFVHMVDTYQNPKTTPWLDQVTLLRLEDKANAHRGNLVGNIAADLILADTAGQTFDLKKVEANGILLIFYSPLCAHCQEAMPKIYEAFLAFEPRGLKAIAVNTDKELDYWKNHVKEKGRKWLDVMDPTFKNAYEKPYSTWNLPVIYLLDKDKRILRKRVKPEELGELLGKFYKN
jgi:peroxiredoxin